MPEAVAARSPSVLFAAYAPRSAATGMGKWAAEIVRELEALGYVVTRWDQEDFAAVARWRRFRVLVFPLVLAARIVRRRATFDAVVIHEPGGFWYGVLRRTFGSLPPMTVICHNVESKVFGTLREAHRAGFARRLPWSVVSHVLLRRWQSDGAIRLADQVICLSEEDRRYIAARVRGPRPGTTRVTNGVRADEYDSPRARSGNSHVLFVGGWLDIKGRRVLPRLWAAVLHRCPQATLTIVGSGRGADDVRRDFPASARDRVVVTEGVADPSAMRDAYSRHDVLVMPSLSEGSPLALLEAMAAGLPVLATAVGGIPDVIRDGESGLLFDWRDPGGGADAVCRLLADPVLAARLGRAARERARGLTWRDAASGVAAAIERARSRRTPSGGVTP